MRTKLSKLTKGFTIIEVLIVLAIAGLIMLIVFLAVPALQRNARNTNRKTDIGRIGGAATTVISNNNGDTSSLTSANLRTEVGTFGYYTPSNVSVVGWTTAHIANTATTDTAVLYTGATCTGSIATAGNTRQMATEYRLETDTPQCTGI